MKSHMKELKQRDEGGKKPSMKEMLAKAKKVDVKAAKQDLLDKKKAKQEEMSSENM